LNFSGERQHNFAFADRSIKPISQSISLVFFQRLSICAGGEVVDATQY
jgi:hypothetical protein